MHGPRKIALRCRAARANAADADSEAGEAGVELDAQQGARRGRDELVLGSARFERDEAHVAAERRIGEARLESYEPIAREPGELAELAELAEHDDESVDVRARSVRRRERAFLAGAQ